MTRLLVALLALATAGAAAPPPVRCTFETKPDGTTVITCPKKPRVLWVG
jgi:hypothetical protein